jgi:hypothetical protein
VATVSTVLESFDCGNDDRTGGSSVNIGIDIEVEVEVESSDLSILLIVAGEK